mmetsp:Transcript_2449/g.5808  ORF Transcript_2449/g.5808 Transcript_2449/m.5808 type:complete len:317 (+) Transcript_2449:3332-4282(+)
MRAALQPLRDGVVEGFDLLLVRKLLGLLCVLVRDEGVHLGVRAGQRVVELALTLLGHGGTDPLDERVDALVEVLLQLALLLKLGQVLLNVRVVLTVLAAQHVHAVGRVRVFRDAHALDLRVDALQLGQPALARLPALVVAVDVGRQRRRLAAQAVHRGPVRLQERHKLGRRVRKLLALGLHGLLARQLRRVRLPPLAQRAHERLAVVLNVVDGQRGVTVVLDAQLHQVVPHAVQLVLARLGLRREVRVVGIQHRLVVGHRLQAVAKRGPRHLLRRVLHPPVEVRGFLGKVLAQLLHALLLRQLLVQLAALGTAVAR